MHWINVLYWGWISISVTKFSLANWIKRSPINWAKYRIREWVHHLSHSWDRMTLNIKKKRFVLVTPQPLMLTRNEREKWMNNYHVGLLRLRDHYSLNCSALLPNRHDNPTRSMTVNLQKKAHTHQISEKKKSEQISNSFVIFHGKLYFAAVHFSS